MNFGGQLKKLLAGKVTDANFGAFVSALFTAGVSNVHLDPQAKDFSIRLRQGKQLVSAGSFSQTDVLPLVEFIKRKSGLKTHHGRTPDESGFLSGGFLVKVFSLPVIDGEKISLKIIKRNGTVKNLSELGLWGDALTAVRKVPELGSGLVLTLGDGHLQTMFSVLAQFDAQTTDIATIEHLQTTNLPLVNQFVAEKNYSDIAEKALQVATRQNADVIMLSRLDTPKLAELALDASLSGKLVIAGLPINDSFMVPEYLASLGVPTFLLASQLQLIIGQSLVPSAPTEKLKTVKVSAEQSTKILSEAFVDARTIADAEKRAKKAGLNRDLKLNSNDKQIATLYTAKPQDLTRLAGIFEVISESDNLSSLFVTGLHHSEIRDIFIASGGATKEIDYLVKGLRRIVPYGRIV